MCKILILQQVFTNKGIILKIKNSLLPRISNLSLHFWRHLFCFIVMGHIWLDSFVFYHIIIMGGGRNRWVFSAEVPWRFQKASLRTLLDMKSSFTFQSKQAWSKLNIKCQYANIIGTFNFDRAYWCNACSWNSICYNKI